MKVQQIQSTCNLLAQACGYTFGNIRSCRYLLEMFYVAWGLASKDGQRMAMMVMMMAMMIIINGNAFDIGGNDDNN